VLLSASTQPDSRLAADPIVLQQIDRVSLLAWKETLGPKYPLTVARADSINMILDFFSAANSEWHAQGELTQTPMFAGFYRWPVARDVSAALSNSHMAPAVSCSFASAGSSTAAPRRRRTSIAS
jgi:hypothetical protein